MKQETIITNIANAVDSINNEIKKRELIRRDVVHTNIVSKASKKYGITESKLYQVLNISNESDINTLEDEEYER